MKKSTLSAIVAAMLGTALAGSANAFTITAGSASVTGDRLGLSDWTQGGTNQLASQAWWFNTDAPGATPFNYELADYDAAPTETSTGNTASVSYANILGFDVQIDYTLTGGANQSTLNEGLTITNTTNQAATFTLFQYTDFDLGGYSEYNATGNNVGNGTNSLNYGQNDIVTQLFTNNVSQTNGSVTASELASTVPYPTLTAVGQAIALEDALFAGTVGAAATANGDSFTGDAAWIWQYTFNIAAGQNVVIGKSMLLETVVPVPAAVWLFGSGLLGLVGIARRRA